MGHAEDTSIFDDFPEIEPWHEEPKDMKRHKKTESMMFTSSVILTKDLLKTKKCNP